MTKHIHGADVTFIQYAIENLPQLLLVFPFVIALYLYIFAVVVSNRNYKQWPLYRTVSWISGIICAAIAVAGPIAQRAHEDFTIHMVSHLLLGMLSPLLMALAAPMTLILSTLNVTIARRFSRILKSGLVRVLSDPIMALFLNVGGLWILYTTDLYVTMHHNATLHVLIHMHVFLAGYLFTISMIYFDPTPHRTSYVYRSIVLVVALAGHGILSKYIYANPPPGVPSWHGEVGAMLMYYGGDAIDIVLIFILCLQWYKAARPREFSSLEVLTDS